jgi:PII-like signaling protein
MSGASCLKLTGYFSERDRAGHALLADALFDLYAAHGVENSVLLRGVEGFGGGHHVHTDRILTLSEDLPVVTVAVDRSERIEAALDDVQGLERHGLFTLERARFVVDDTVVGDERAKLTIYVGRRERVGRVPAFVAVCEILHRAGLDGATVLLGVDGTRRGVRERARFFSGNSEVPTMIISVGAGARIVAALAALRDALADPLMTLERVRVCKRDGRRLEVPHELPATDEHGLPLWQKLTIYSSERARHGGLPLHRALLRRLIGAEVAGATSLRGVWGFHGDHPPHGDRRLQTHRHVPVLTVIVDRPERIEHAFAVVDEVTADAGLVTSERVPAVV